jgi:hypothetical protein
MKIERISALFALTASIAAVATPWPAAAEKKPLEVSKNIIAVQIRKQGYECKNPQSAERDAAASQPDDAAWILNCEGVSYRVKLIPNMAATVERLPDKSQPEETKK